MAVTDDTLKLAAGMRIALSSTVDGATADLTRAWARAWDSLAGEWEAAVAELAAAGTDGSWPTLRQIARADRATRALAASQQALHALARETGVRVLQDVPNLTADAAYWQARLIAAQLPATAGPQLELVAGFNRVDRAQLSAIVTRTTQQVTALSWPIEAAATAAMKTEIVRGIALGKNPRAAAARMVARVEGQFNGGLTRALVIARTEMLDAHRAAEHASRVANRDVLAGWTWQAKLDAETCPSCWAQHGGVHPVDEVGPLDHQCGRCTAIPRTKTWRELGYDLDEPADLFPDRDAAFAALSRADQLQVMGPARLAGLDDGSLTWSDLSTRRATDGWRDSYVPTPLKDLPRRATA